MGQMIAKEINSKLIVYRCGRHRSTADLLIDRCRNQHDEIYRDYMDEDTPLFITKSIE